MNVLSPTLSQVCSQGFDTECTGVDDGVEEECFTTFEKKCETVKKVVTFHFFFAILFFHSVTAQAILHECRVYLPPPGSHCICKALKSIKVSHNLLPLQSLPCPSDVVFTACAAR